MTKTVRKGTKKTAAKVAESTATAVRNKPAAKKAAAKKTVAKKAPAKKAVAKKKKVVAKKKSAANSNAVKKAPAGRAAVKKKDTRRITASDRRQMIAEAAYLRAEARGFLSDEREDWLLAEAEINMRLRRAKIDVIE